MVVKKQNGQAEPLKLSTMSNAFEAARQVTALTQIAKCATFSQFAARLKALGSSPKHKEEMIALFDALNRLDASSATLGNTTLIHPAEHPLVVRTSWEPGDTDRRKRR